MESLRSLTKRAVFVAAFIPVLLAALYWTAGAQNCVAGIDSLNCAAAVSGTTYGQAYGIDTRDGRAYVAVFEAGLSVVDISVPLSPVFMDTIPTLNRALGVALSDGFAFVADDSAELTVVDVSNPANLVFVANVKQPGGRALDIALKGGYAFVANGDMGLAVYNVSTPAAPTYVTSLDTDGLAIAIAISGDFAYIGDSGDGLEIVDISDPSNPMKVGIVDTPGNAQGVAIHGNFAFVADSDKGMAVIDISVPASPTLVTSIALPGLATNLTVWRDYAFVTGYTAGLILLDVSNPAAPVMMDACGTPGPAMAVRVWDDAAFVADIVGLQVIPFTFTPIVATIDFDPNTLNLKSNGKWVTCYIELEEGCDVGDIDRASIMLNDSIPAESRPSEIGDNDEDGIADLMVKFDRAAVQGILAPGSDVAVIVTGLVGGEEFRGTDSITVMAPPDSPPPKDDAPGNTVSLKARPNPFNPSVEIVYDVPSAARVRMEILSVTGRLVTTLEDVYRPAGQYSVPWNGKDAAGNDVASGLYVCRLTVGSKVASTKLTLLK